MLFGYIRTNRSELLVKEDALYKSVYCALCKKLGKNYGSLSRLTLNYDCTFLAVLLIGLNSESQCFEQKRCTSNPLKKCAYFCGEEEIFNYAAAVSEILTYWKIRDDLSDEKFFRRITSSLALAVYSHKRKKAAKDYPLIDSVVSETIKLQKEAEEQKEGFSLDLCAEPSAKMLSEIVSYFSKEDEKRILQQLGYHLGRWVYFIDAADDIEKDLKSGSFNPFIISYSITKDNFDEIKENVYIKCNEVLNFSIVPILTAMQLLPLRSFASVVENIIAKGLPEMQRKSLFSEKKEGSFYDK